MSELKSVRIADVQRTSAFRPLSRTGAIGAELPSAALPANTMDPFEDGYQRGVSDAEKEFAAERQSYRALLSAFEALQPEPSEPLALLIAETVEALVRATVGGAEIDTHKLRERAEAAAALVAASDGARVVHLNPADVELIGTDLLPLEVVGDDSIPRGSIRVEHPTGWIEHGIELHLQSLREQLGLKEPRQ